SMTWCANRWRVRSFPASAAQSSWAELPPTALLLLALALDLDQLRDLLLECGDRAFHGAQAAFHALLARLFTALILGQSALQFQHPLAQFAVFILEIKIVLHDDAHNLAHAGLAVEHRLLAVGDGAEDVAERL